jgi:dipeptidyl aminopeptidase/acylaminoacyl peptidase
MRLKSTRLFYLALILVFAAGLSAQKRAITEKDLFQFNWIGDPQVSPDGSRVVFVKITVNDKRDNYDTSLWTVSTGGNEAPERLTTGKHDSGARWSPDGKRLAFLRAPDPSGAGPESRPQPQIYLLSLSGGEPQPLTRLTKGAGQPIWSPDGKHIAFTSTTTPEEFAKQQEKDRKSKEADKSAVKSEKPAATSSSSERPSENKDEAESGGAKSNLNPEHESDVRVITRAVYRINGGGYLDPTHPAHIWVVAVPDSLEDVPTPRQLTTGKFADQEALWSKDGSLIYFTSTHIDEPYYEQPTSDLYSVSPSGSGVQKITKLDFGAHSLSLSPDGTRLALRGSPNPKPVQSYTQPDLWVVELKTGAVPKNLTLDFDYDVGSGVGGDNAPPRAAGGSRPIWTAEGRDIIDVVGKEGRANLMQFDAASGKVSDVTRGDHDIESFQATRDGRIVAMISTPTQVGDLFVFDDGDFTPHRLTNINEKLFSQLNLTEPEEFWYTSFDGKKIQAWIQKPPDFDSSKKYPLILDIHGGPHTAYGYVFDHEFQWMAAKGYVVLYPNPRGSTSYGQAFGNIIQYHYPGDDYRDLMIGVDELVKRGYIDPKKLGVTGGSGGGLLTDWVVGHTTRFAAAVAQRDISDWAGWWGAADFTLFQPSWFKAPPFQDPADFAQRSPITYVEKVRTPMMFILGEADYRTPPGSGGEYMFRALKFLKRPTIMIRFPGESHELSRSGQPWHRIERLQHIVGWFDKYLQGKHIAAYDDVTGQAVSVNPATTPPPSE